MATAVSLALLFAAIVGYTQMFAGRAAYILTGVLIGTIMTGNVWLCILPSQRALIDASQIANLDRELGEHLDRAVRTGTYCIYRP